MKLRIIVAAVIAATACTGSRGRGSDTGQAAQGSDTSQAAQGDVARLEREARALAKSDGCRASGECRTAPLGARPCGGPRDYLVYCWLTTDSAALFRKLAELERAEKAYNEQAGLISTCEFRTPPDVTLEGGSCRATAGPPRLQ